MQFSDSRVSDAIFIGSNRRFRLRPLLEASAPLSLSAITANTARQLKADGDGRNIE